ncbi:hypothetical protein FOCC_FOCC012252, partial [Frankliniella occidentalis]
MPVEKSQVRRASDKPALRDGNKVQVSSCWQSVFPALAEHGADPGRCRRGDGVQRRADACFGVVRVAEGRQGRQAAAVPPRLAAHCPRQEAHGGQPTAAAGRVRLPGRHQAQVLLRRRTLRRVLVGLWDIDAVRMYKTLG